MPMPVSANYPKFTTEELYAFIHEYEKHPMLYDFDHPLYTNYVERTKRFMAIARALNIEGLTAERVRAKIKVFRGNYTHRLKDMYKKERAGEPFHAPRWWYLADAFLRQHIRFLDPDIIDTSVASNQEQFNGNRSTHNNSGEDAEIYFGSDMPVSSTIEIIDTNDEDDSGECKMMNIKTEAIDDSQTSDNNIYLELDDEQLMAIENGEISIEDVTARAEAAASQHQQQITVNRLESSKDSVRSREEDDENKSPNADSENEDEFDAFGRCVALQLKTLPTDTALELESQIHSLITRKRMVLLRKNKLHPNQG